MMDRALWITWYDLPEEDRDAYLDWAHRDYLPRLLDSGRYLHAAHFASVPQVTMTLSPNNSPRAIAIVPIPLVPPWTRTQSPSAAKPRSNKFTQTVNKVSGIAAASARVSPSGTGRQVPIGAAQYSA